MPVDDVADVFVRPAAGVADQPRGVLVFDQRDQAFGIVLAPALVEHDPHDDGGVVVESGGHGQQFIFKLPFRFVGLVVSAGHVLPDQ